MEGARAVVVTETARGLGVARDDDGAVDEKSNTCML
jgi:hypothetical protein